MSGERRSTLSSLRLETDLTSWFIQATFIAAIVFAAIYIPFYDWRGTLTGKAVTTLILCIAGALLHSVLVLWGVHRESGFWADFITWLAILSLGGAAVSIIVLTFEMLRGIFSETDKPWLCKVLLLGRKFSSLPIRKLTPCIPVNLTACGDVR